MTSYDDIVIAVMGSTGAGKSSFIRLLSGDTSVGVGDSLESETVDVQLVRFLDPISRRNIVLVDTPGFDDSRPEITDTEVLKRIGSFLVEEWVHFSSVISSVHGNIKRYNANRKLNGLIYVQTMAQPRFSRQSARNLKMFRNLCGAENYKNIVVLTTFWDMISEELGQRREAQLKSQFFKNLVDGGACFMRDDRTVKGAQGVLKQVIALGPMYTQLADELGRQKMDLENTAAGSVQREEVEQMIAKHKQEVAQLREEMRAMKDNNAATMRMLKEERMELQKKLAKWETERAELRRGLEEDRSALKQLENDAKLERSKNDVLRLQQELDFHKRLDAQGRENDKAMQDLKDMHSAEWKRVAEEARKGCGVLLSALATTLKTRMQSPAPLIFSNYNRIVVSSSAADWDAAAFCLVTPPIDKSEMVASVRFTLQSHDQGRADEGKLGTPSSPLSKQPADYPSGTYLGSHTWFQAAIIRDTNPNIAAMLLNMGTISNDTLNRQTKYAPYSEGWHLQHNICESSQTRTHMVAWSRSGTISEGEAIKQGCGTGDGFLSALAPGDRIAVIARAKVRNWLLLSRIN
ncbi:hypothetical protein AX14_000905 [Amanita brunnescens Koide BX004]|nr:hypothetical protein AX14_000905 [Amanita brunnescens Koide BX004]